jgi:hypothetical protein
MIGVMDLAEASKVEKVRAENPFLFFPFFSL